MKINNPFKWLKEKVKQILSKADDAVLNHLDDCIDFVNDVKALVDSPITQAVIKITPTNKDNQAAAAFEVVMNEIADVLSIMDKCRYEPSQQLRLKCFVDEMRSFHPEKRNMIYSRLAAWLFKDKFNLMPNHTLETMVQARYWERKNS